MYVDLTLSISVDKYFQSESPAAKFGHTGTHIDISPTFKIDLKRFISRGKLIDVSHIRGRQIEIDDIKDQVEINKDDFVIIKTNWLEENYPTRNYFLDNPELSNNAVDFLISQKLNMIGIDAPGLVQRENHSKIDKLCLDHNILIVENLNNLDKLSQNTFKVYCFPMNLSGQSGLPVRIIAEI